MKRYPSHYAGAGTAPGRCVQLIEEASLPPGIALDLGCGRAPLADPIKDGGLEYVGVDIDPDALAEVTKRGFETHQLDLGGSEEELLKALTEIVRGRHVSAVLAVDLLEHLTAPEVVLRALRELVGEESSLIVSVPNITHLNISAKLLLGRWDLTDQGLMDDTHMRFFSEPLLARLFRATGWRQVAVADAANPDPDDQRFPADAPALRNGTPARELLRRLRSAGDPHGGTYQFVRRFLPDGTPAQKPFRWAVDEEPEQRDVFASVLVSGGGGQDELHDRLMADLAAQTVTGLEIVEVKPNAEGWNRAIAEAQGRYLCIIDRGVRISPRWIEEFEAVSGEQPGRVLVAGVVSAAPKGLATTSTEEVIAAGKPLEINQLDLLAPGRTGPTVLAAYATPTEVIRTAGLRFEPEMGGAAAVVFLSRAAELSGVAVIRDSTVAVTDAFAHDFDAELATVAEAMDPTPIILPVGSAGRIAALRMELIDMRRSLSWRITKPLRAGYWLRDLLVEWLRRRGWLEPLKRQRAVRWLRRTRDP